MSTNARARIPRSTQEKKTVQVVFGGVKAIYERGLELESGEKVDVDATICASGFDMSYIPQWKFIGRNN
jgi:hypothetical protein